MPPIALQDAAGNISLRALLLLHICIEIPQLVDGATWRIKVVGIIFVVILDISASSLEVRDCVGKRVFVKPVEDQ